MTSYEIGMSASYTKRISEDNVNSFADISGDTNPVHLNDKYAKKTIFEKRIVHGMLTASLISKVLGTMMPGEGSIYLKQELKFVKPVFIDEEITASVMITDIEQEKRIMTLDTKCINQIGEEVIVGNAKLLVPTMELKETIQ